MNNTEKEKKQRRLLLVLPLLVLPFLTMIFWAMGGGQVEKANAAESGKPGINTMLPDATAQDEELDKMAYYDQATRDSVKEDEQRRNDPVYDRYTEGHLDSEDYQKLRMDPPALNFSTGQGPIHKEAQINAKLAQLNMAMNGSNPSGSSYNNHTNSFANEPAIRTADLDRLERMMKSMGSSQGEDPEMQQLSGMLDKIMDIQNPGRQQEQMRRESAQKRGQVFSIASLPKKEMIGNLDHLPAKSKAAEGNGFYSIEDLQEAENPNTVSAVVSESQTLTNGSNIRMRLGNDIYVNGILIPKGNTVTGIVALSGERLGVKISGIRYRSSLYPVDLSVYDIDGQEGIYVPGAIAREVAKSSTESSIQGIGINGFDQSLGIQAANLGIEAAKGFMSKKVKLVRVTVKSGYELLLRDEKQKQDKQ